MAKPRRKPQNPLEQRRRDFEAVGLQREAASLPQHSDVQITREAEDREGKQVDHNVARRSDAFDALKAGMSPGVYDACRRLERDLLIARCEGDKGRRMERVDGADPEDERDFRFVLAADRVARLGRVMPKRDWWLLNELFFPSTDYDGWTPRTGNEEEDKRARPFTGWRAVVGYVTGETHPHAQGARVRAAGANLLDAYDALDRGEARRAA